MDKFDDFFFLNQRAQNKNKRFFFTIYTNKTTIFPSVLFQPPFSRYDSVEIGYWCLSKTPKRRQESISNEFYVQNWRRELKWYWQSTLLHSWSTCEDKESFFLKKNCARWWEIRWYCWSGKIGETSMRSLHRLTLGLKPPGVDSWLVRIPSHGLSSKCSLVNPGMSKVHSTFRHNCYWNSMYYRPRAQLCRGFSRVSIQS